MGVTAGVLAHLEWLGYVQPVGLVVSATALDATGAVINRGETTGPDGLRRCIRQRVLVPGGDPVDCLPDFHQFAREVLGWTFDPVGYAGVPGAPIPDGLRIVLPDEGGMLEPLCAVREREPGPDDDVPFQLLVLAFDGGRAMDTPFRDLGRYEASPSSRMERLLRETGVPAGLVFTGTVIRLLVAPRGESSGWIDFRLDHMLTVPGRPIAAALRLLLSQPRLLTMPKAERLPALLRASRRYQSAVSVALAGQVLHGLYELVRGFQAARSSRGGDPLGALITADGTVSGDVYHGLLTVMMRLLFLLYAEERDLLPGDEDFRTHYGLAALFERLREDATVHEDTMDQRYGAWAQLLMLFRMVHDGVPDLGLVARKGSLFDPEAFPFLEGRRHDGATEARSLGAVPRVPDGTVHRVLEKLLMLGGERLSYRS
ncbi:MAG: class I SAM-dependent DNA methyltransferase, partial [Actinobacteria bacterium]|nr:class I SAM-dependent DNA methyltransferase [Actinomycetota bacterium]